MISSLCSEGIGPAFLAHPQKVTGREGSCRKWVQANKTGDHCGISGLGKHVTGGQIHERRNEHQGRIKPSEEQRGHEIKLLPLLASNGVTNSLLLNREKLVPPL